MKTRNIKGKPLNKSRANTRNKAVRSKLLKKTTNEGTGVSQQSDIPVEPHQARQSDEIMGESYHDSLEYIKYRIFETIKDIKP